MAFISNHVPKIGTLGSFLLCCSVTGMSKCYLIQKCVSILAHHLPYCHHVALSILWSHQSVLQHTASLKPASNYFSKGWVSLCHSLLRNITCLVRMFRMKWSTCEVVDKAFLNPNQLTTISSPGPFGKLQQVAQIWQFSSNIPAVPHLHVLASVCCSKCFLYHRV